MQFVGWRGDADELLAEGGPTVVEALSAAAQRGAQVRGLLWHAHTGMIGSQLGPNRTLARAVTLVRPGGRIVFSNCSLDPLEGEALYGAFLTGTADIVDDPLRPGEIAGIVTMAAHVFVEDVTIAGIRRTTQASLTNAETIAATHTCSGSCSPVANVIVA